MCVFLIIISKMFRRKYVMILMFHCFFLLTIMQTVYCDVRDDVLEYLEPKSCSKYEYFDTDLFKCKKCGNNLVSSDDRLRCICGINSKTIGTKDGNPICKSCEPGKILTIDGHDCISCRNNGACRCSGNEMKIERNWNGTILDQFKCLPCPENTFSSGDGSQCLPCIISVTARDGNCHNFYEGLYEYCLPKTAPTSWPDVRNTYLTKFKRISIDSYYFRTELRLTFYSCQKGEHLACEHLANMCVLTLFTDSTPCKLFMGKNDLPTKLFYQESDTRTVLNRRTITQRYTLDQKNPNSKLKIIVAAFSLRGTFESIGELSLSCPFFSSVRFGVNMKKRCKISAVELTNDKILFIVPYLSYSDVNNGKKLLHALPVLFKKSNTNDNDVTRWQLVRKFFSVDRITGYKAIPNTRNASFTKSSSLEALRYIKSLNLLIKVQERNERGKIFPPLVIVEYAELTKEQIIQNVEVSVEYRVTYSLADDEISNGVEICIGVFTGLAVAFSAIKAWSHCRRNYDNIPNIATSSWFIVYCFGAIGNALILVCLGACIYTFIFYKGQKVLHILLPNDGNEFTIRVCTIVASAFKTIETLALIYHQRNINLFFIDWEQPRKMSTPLKYDSPHTSLRKSYTGRFSAKEQNTLQSASEIIGARRNKTPSKSSQASTPSRQSVSKIFDPGETVYPAVCLETNFSIDESSVSQNYSVSIWRTYVVANEWLKIKTKRKINVLLQMIATLFILEIVGVKYWTMAVPELMLEQEEVPSVEKSFTLQYAVGSLVYIFVYSIQWFFSVFVYEKYIKNRLQEFIDLCSVANISVFILSHDYYGYYIHGRSVHGFADTDLLTLINDLEREENNLCAHRGLIPGTTEQTFVLFLSKTFRSFYDTLQGPKNSNDRKFLRSNVSKIPDWDTRWMTHLKLRKFLTGFLDHCFKNVDYTIKERHFLEKLCDMEMVDVEEKSVFYIDNNYSFDQTIFYGNECLLATFEMTIFSLVLVLGGDYILASVVTVFVAKSIDAIARLNGKRILANKTLIDERFLVS